MKVFDKREGEMSRSDYHKEELIWGNHIHGKMKRAALEEAIRKLKIGKAPDIS